MGGEQQALNVSIFFFYSLIVYITKRVIKLLHFLQDQLQLFSQISITFRFGFSLLTFVVIEAETIAAISASGLVFFNWTSDLS